MSAAETVLYEMFKAALAAADPAQILPPALVDLLAAPPPGRVVVVGAGKAGGAMAHAFEGAWRAAHPGRPVEGLVITRWPRLPDRDD